MAEKGIRKRGEGSWQIYYDVPRGTHGERQRMYEPVKGTLREARELRLRRLHEVRTGTYLRPTEETLGDYLERWLTELAPLKAPSPNTLRGYASKLRTHVIPRLGHLKLGRVTPDQIQDLITDLLERGLSRQTVRHVYTILNGALNKAVRLKLIRENPCDGVDAPTPDVYQAEILTLGELRHLLQVTRGTKLEIPVHIAGTMGVRRGEILAVRWEDIDWQRNEISFRRSLTDAGQIEKRPKSENGVRVIPMPLLLRRVLEEHRSEQASIKQRPGYRDLGLVVAGPSGHYLRPDSLSRCFRRLADQLGLPNIHLHSLRHTYASLLGEIERNPKVIQELLGHGDMKMALHYMHTFRDRQQHHRTAAFIDELLEEAKPETENEQ